jgi:ribonuclease G
MAKEMVISAAPHETRVAILEDGQLFEIYVERQKEFALVGSIYKGKVTRVLPGMQSAFVEIGLDTDAFLYVSDFLEDLEEYDQIVHTVEDKVQRMEEQGGEALSSVEVAQGAAFEPSDVVSAAPENPAATPFLPPPIVDSSPSNPPSRPQNAPFRPNDRDRGGFGGRGRPGRHGRRGGRRDRELPSSKFASQYVPDDTPAQAPGASPENHEPIILPGESLAKYRNRTAEGTASAAPSELSTADAPVSVGQLPTPPRPEESSQEISGANFREPSAYQPSASDEMPDKAFGLASRDTSRGPSREPDVQPSRTYETRQNRPRGYDAGAAPRRAMSPGASEESPFSTRPSAGGHLEPLPGESIARAKTAPGAEAPPRPAEERSGAGFAAQHIESAGASYWREESAPVTAPESGPGNRESGTAVHDVRNSYDRYDKRGQSDDDDSSENLAESPATPDASGEMESAEASVELGEMETAGTSGDLSSDARFDETASVHLGEPDERFDGQSNGQDDAREDADQAGGPEFPAEDGNSESYPGQPPMQARVRNDFRARMQQPGRRGRPDRSDNRSDRRGRRDNRGGGQRDNRPQQGRDPQPRRPQLIAEMLKAGEEIIVQIAKEPLGKKGARITSHVALPGRFLVYMPTLHHTGVSRKIASAEERARLRHLVSDAQGSAGGGFIVRTAASQADPNEVRADVEFLTRTWSEIKARAEQRRAPSLLHRDLNLVERLLRDYLCEEYTTIWVDSEEEYTKVVDFVSRFQPKLLNRVRLYGKETPVFEEFGIQQEIDKALRPKVWLKSGGHIVINHTEALVAIDVNTGKFVGRGSVRLEDTIVKANLEAVKEIVRQIRLRDLGGIIVIDFIDMEERRNRDKVMAALEDALRTDRAPSKVLRFNEFGLVAITRKRTKQALERTLCQPCPYCTGSGMVKSLPTLCYEIQTEARKMAAEMESGSLTLRVHTEIAKALKTRESALIEELEHWTKKHVIIQADATLHWEQYDIY